MIPSKHHKMLIANPSRLICRKNFFFVVILSINCFWETSQTVCENIPAGLNKLVLGVDVTKLSLEPLDFTKPDGYAGPVIDFTCDQGRVWVNPYDGKTYQEPDQIWKIEKVPGGWLNAVTKVYKSYCRYIVAIQMSKMKWLLMPVLVSSAECFQRVHRTKL